MRGSKFASKARNYAIEQRSWCSFLRPVVAGSLKTVPTQRGFNHGSYCGTCRSLESKYFERTCSFLFLADAFDWFWKDRRVAVPAPQASSSRSDRISTVLRFVIVPLEAIPGGDLSVLSNTRRYFEYLGDRTKAIDGLRRFVRILAVRSRQSRLLTI